MSKKIYSKPNFEDEDILEIADALTGYTVVRVGKTEKYSTSDYKGFVEGGLTLILSKGGKTRKVILGYTELGEWLEHVADLKEKK